MLSALALAALALVAGLVGTWSPCGLSAIETVTAPEAGGDRPATRGAALAAFTAGCLLGGVVLLGGAALAGAALGTDLVLPAALVLAAAAAADAAGLPVVPRIARQVPEPWRRHVPLPVAALGYGALLGLGLTTFVMSYALWAAILAALLLGSPATGVAAGIAFGVGRAAPVVLVGIAWGSRLAEVVLERMLLSGGALRRARRIAALTAAGGALVLAPLAVPARAGQIPGAYAVSAAPEGVVAVFPGGSILARPGLPNETLPRDAAIGGGALAWREGETVVVVDLATRAERGRVVVPGADALAVHGDRVAIRAQAGRRAYVAVWQAGGEAPPRPVLAGPAGSLARPAMDGATLVLGRADRRGSRILAGAPDGTGLRVVRRVGRGRQIWAPSVAGGRIAWIEADRCRQRVRTGTLAGRGGRTVRSWASPVRRDGGFTPGYVDAYDAASKCSGRAGGAARIRLWGTALGPSGLYVTLVDRAGRRPRVLVLPAAGGS